jgi:hypothetical protein
MVCCLCGTFTSIAFAQREQAGIRYEFFGPRPTAGSTPASLNGSQIGMSLLTVNGGFQSQLDKEGASVLNVQFVYRNAMAQYGVPAAGGTFNQASITGHAIYSDILFLQTLSDKFQLAAAARAGLFTDFNNINLSHFRIEPLFFLDYFFDDKFIAGLGFVYNTSNFGRLISVPLLHIYWIPTPEILVDGLLPTRLDFWYYPSKQVDLGLSIVLNGTQFQLGQAPAIPGIDRTMPEVKRVQDINQMFFANATVGPNIRYNLFDKTYISLEGGYSIVRRFGFDAGSPAGSGLVPARNGAGAAYGDTDYIASYLRGFDFSINTWFVRAGIQIMY